MSTQGKLLIVDDEPSVRESLGRWFREEGYEVTAVESPSDALTRLAEQRWDAALVDIKTHLIDGIDLPHRIHEVDPELIVIIMSGYASVETAVAALKNGAYDYVTKPLDPDEIAHLVKNALTYKRAAQENVLLREAIAEAACPGELIGQSSPMRKIFGAIETVGPTDATVLVTGESGTGKELLARAVHQASSRRFHPLVVIHCGALTERLLESELFGHEKGAFTGAQHRKKGKFEIAEGGTIFLDEIGDISIKTQTGLLRVLQEREITRVGGNQIIKVDFRCIAATNKDLEKLIEEGKFHPDLFYRLNFFRIELPPLRDRREDIPPLVDHFVRKFSLAMNRRITRVTREAMNQLQQQPWLGNVRELQNAVERAMVVGTEPELHEQDFIFKPESVPASNASGKKLEEMERAHILRIVKECGGNQSHAAEILDIDRVTLYHKLKKYGWTRTPTEPMKLTR